MSKYRSSQLKHKKKVRFYFRISIFLIFTGLLIFGSIFWLNHSVFNISGFSVIEQEYSDEESIKKEIQKVLDKKIFFFIPKTNLLFLPYVELNREISNNIPAVSSLEFDLQNWDFLEIKVNEYNAIARYCYSDCYLVNENGILFSKEPDLFIEDVFVLEGPISSSDASSTEENLIGQKYVETRTFEKLFEVSDFLNLINIKTNRILTEDHETYEIYTNDGPYLLIDRFDDPEKVVNNLNALIEQEAINEAQFGNIEYIDLRFGKKIYYKLK